MHCKEEAKYKNDRKEGLEKFYLENGKLDRNDNPISAKSGNGRKWTKKELSNYRKKGLKSKV